MKNFLVIVSLLVFSLSKAQTPITTIPFELFGDHIIIKVSVDNSRPLDFIFDTASGYTLIDSDISDELKLSGKKVKMNHASLVMELIKHNELEINGFPMEKNIKVYSTDLDHLEISLGRDIDGIVGYDLLHHHTVHIDYDKKMLGIYDHGNGPKRGDAIPFTLDTSIPVIKGNVVLNNNEAHEGSFFVMTGAGTTLDFNAPYAKKYDVIHKTGKHYSYLVKSISEEETPHFEGHVLSVSFGNQEVKDLPIGISQANSGIQAHPEVSGILGNQLLSMFNITIDIPDKMIWLEKNTNFGEKLYVNCSGIDLQLTPDKKRVLIHQVFDDSPADKAGIKLNDELVSVNDTSVQELDLPDIKKMLRGEGEKVNLVILQDGKEKDVSLTLQSLID